MGSRAKKYGDVSYYFGSLAVHLKAPSGRINYRMHGFSQIMDAYYLAQKGSISKHYVIYQILLRKLLQNLILAFIPKQTSKEYQLLW